MQMKKIQINAMNGAVVVALIAALSMVSSVTAFAREAESGGGSNSGNTSASTGAVSSAPRVDDNPSARDLIEGTRVLAPGSTGVHVSGFDSARDIAERGLSGTSTSMSGFDSARDIAERGLTGTSTHVSGFDSARDLFERDLAFGMRGDDGVAHLQRELQDDGFFHSAITGNFMELTRKAVAEFQAAHGIPATGFVGALTRKELNDRISNRGSMNSGSGNAQASRADIEKLIRELTEKVRQLQAQLSAIAASR